MSSLHRLLPRAPMTSLWSTAARRLSLCLSLLLALAVAPATAQTVFFHNDVAGSPIAATDQAGNLMWRETYRPYGGRMIKPVAANTQWFHGKPLDPDTGLEDFGARNYDPDLGRFLSVDPVEFQDQNIHSFNRYAYGNNNPLKYKDPDGRLPIVLIAVAVMKVADIAMTAYDTYQSYQAEGAGGAATTLGTSMAMSAVPGLKVGKAVVHEAATVAKSIEGVAAKGAEKTVYRLGESAESASRLGRKSAEAEGVIGHHGVSVSTTKPPAGVPCSSASCSSLEARGFKVLPTPTRNDPNHQTVVLPNPVTKEVAKDFNDAFGR